MNSLFDLDKLLMYRSATTIRDATVDDVAKVRCVAMESWRWTYTEIFSTEFIEQFIGQYYSVDSLTKSIENAAKRGETFTVAEKHGNIVGFCQIGPSNLGHQLYRMYLKPNFMRQGIGGALLAKSERYLQTNDVADYYTFTHKKNTIALSFYNKHGFVHHPHNDRDDELSLRKTLECHQNN